jgi:hypothetical protein
MTKFLVFFYLIAPSFDSPITSIDFWKESQNNYVYETGSGNDRQINQQIISFLKNPKIPEIDKMSMVNALSWKFKSNYNNAEQYKKNIQWQKASDEQKIIYSYLLVNDNYLNVDKAHEIINSTKNSTEIQKIIKTLIKTQYLFLKDEFEKIWPLFEKEILLAIDLKEPQILSVINKMKEYLILYKT